MRKSRTKKDKMNFSETLLDKPIKRKLTVRDNKYYLVPLPEPFQPTPYVPPKPVPKPIALPRVSKKVTKKVTEKVQKIEKLIDEIVPYYDPEAISQFKKNLKFILKAEITLKKKDDMLSDYCREIKNLHGNSSGSVAKLIPTLNKKTKYVLHQNLKLYLELGLQLTKVHRVLEFSQRKWLKSYIDFNTEMRKDAKNSFEKDFFKLMNNGVFGKTMENLGKICNVEEEKRLLKLTSKPTYISNKIFDENLVGVNTKKERKKLDKPSYVGMCILDLSKTLMYDFHYNYIRKKYTDCQLLFTDTDSLFYHIKTEGDVYKDFWEDRSLFDNSDYPKSSKFFYGENKKVIGKFKDESAGKPILEFIGLKSKMYSYKKEEYEKVKLQITKVDGKPKFEMTKAKDNEKFIKKYVDINNKTAKGVKKNVI